MSSSIENVVLRKNRNSEYYYGSVNSDIIKGMSFVPVIEDSEVTQSIVEEVRDENSYQRPGTKDRMRRFSEYLQQNINALVPPVIISGRDWTFEKNSDESNFGKLIVNSPAAIIDGQHRVGGYIHMFENTNDILPIDFICLTNLSIDDEKKLFIDINSTQKGVPGGIITLHDAQNNESARLALDLHQSPTSPFCGKIGIAKVAKNQLFGLKSIAQNIDKMFNHGKLERISEEEKFQKLVSYWDLISNIFSTEWSDIEYLDDESSRGKKEFKYKLLELTGFIAFSSIGQEIFARSYVDGVGIDIDKVGRFLQSIHDGPLDLRKEGIYHQAGIVGAQPIVRDMERMLNENFGENSD